MIIDASSFTDITRHLKGISEGLLEGMRKVVVLSPDLHATQSGPQADWLAAVEAFVQVNHEVMSLAELLRALLDANEDFKPTKAALS